MERAQEFYGSDQVAKVIKQVSAKLQSTSVEVPSRDAEKVKEVRSSLSEPETSEDFDISAEGRCERGDCENGSGVYVFADGDKYTGSFQNGRFNGRGIFVTTDGDKYDGSFKDDEFYGTGVYLFADGRKYRGEFKHDEFHGKGTMLYPNGDKYVGEFKNDQFNGKGIYYHADGRTESGMFRNGENTEQ